MSPTSDEHPAISPVAGPASSDGRAGSVDATRRQAELASRVADVTRLSDLGAPVSRMVDIHAVLVDVLRTVLDVVRAERGAIALYDAAADALSVAARVGFPPEFDETVHRLEVGEGAVGTALASGRPVIVEDVFRDPLLATGHETARRFGYLSVYVVPLVTVGNEVMGMIGAYWADSHRPDERETHLVETYARQAADMVERARLHGEARMLAAKEQRRAAQLRELADTALALSSERDAAALLRIVTEAAKEIVGTHQAAASRLLDGWDEALTHVALSDAYAAYRGYGEHPRGLGLRATMARRDRPLRLSRAELAAHPDFRHLADAPAHPPLPNYLGAPLVGRDGANLGVVHVSDKVDGTEFTTEDEAILVQLAQMASAAFQRTELVERHRSARAEAERLAQRYRLLSDASKQFSASLEPSEALSTITRIVVPTIAEWCAIDLVGEDGRLRRVEATAADERVAERAARISAPMGPREPPDVKGAPEVIRGGQSRLYPDLATPQDDDDERGTLASLRAAGARSVAIVPLRARGQVIGALTLLRFTGPAYTADDLAFVEDFAIRAAQAVDNASRYAFERNLAATLQRSLLPQALPVAPGIEVASRYLPGASGTQVGGDWYDIIDLGSGRLGLVVGDVMGRGVGAATVMGQLRAIVRAYALEGHQPVDLLHRVDRVVLGLGDSQLTTCIYAVYDESTRDLTLATAGHLPPLVVGDSAPPRFLDLEPGVPLGVGHGGFSQTRVPLALGSTVLFYTDGLVEARDCGIAEGMDQLLAAAATAPKHPERLCDHVLQAMGRDGDHDDDTALLAVTLAEPRDEPHPDPPVELLLPLDPGSAAVARSFVADTLRARALDRHRDVAVLLASELVTNALRHARTDVRIRVATGRDRVRIEVVDGSGQVPLPRHAIPDQDESGRGMLLVAGLSDRWGTEPGFGGKYVWFELDD